MERAGMRHEERIKQRWMRVGAMGLEREVTEKQESLLGISENRGAGKERLERTESSQ